MQSKGADGGVHLPAAFTVRPQEAVSVRMGIVLQHGALPSSIQPVDAEKSSVIGTRSMGRNAHPLRHSALQSLPPTFRSAIAIVDVCGAVDDAAGVHGQIHARRAQ